jgi:hypothetical protein
MKTVCPDCREVIQSGAKPGELIHCRCGAKIPNGPYAQTTWTVRGSNGKEYEYEGPEPIIGKKVKIVRPGPDVYIKVAEVL